jgi:hypothetical protein
MKSVFSNRFSLLAGLLAMLVSSAVVADGFNQPNWKKEGVDWSKYTRFLIAPLEVGEVIVVRPPWAEDDPQEWTLEIADLEKIQELYMTAVTTALTADGGYEIVDAPAADALEVDVEILSIMPWLRPGSASTKDGMQVTTMGTGEIIASVDLRDSRTRELLLMFAGEKAVGDQYNEFTYENNVANINNMFTEFGANLRRAMDEVHGQ